MIKSCEDILMTPKMHNPLQKDFLNRGISPKLKEDKIMLPLLLFNVVSGLISDKAQDLAKDHVEKMIDDILPDDAKQELDEAIRSDPTHQFENAKDALLGAAEGKLPIPMKDGKFLPIELDFKVKFDPNTRKVEIVQPNQ